MGQRIQQLGIGEERKGIAYECLAVLDGHRGPVRCLAPCLEMDKIVMRFLGYSVSLDQSFKVWSGIEL